MFNNRYLKQIYSINILPPPRGYAGGRIGTRFLCPRDTSPLKGVNRGIEMGLRASSA